MIERLLHLPYVGLWLPVAAALVVAVPLFAWLARSRRAMAVPAGDVPTEPETPPHSTEQRRSFRRGGNSIGVLYAASVEQRDSPLHASVVDRSMGGLCMMTTEPVTVGAVLSVRPVNADTMVPWVEVEVCTCRPGDDSFEVGCRFVKTPPYSILLLFG